MIRIHLERCWFCLLLRQPQYLRMVLISLSISSSLAILSLLSYSTLALCRQSFYLVSSCGTLDEGVCLSSSDFGRDDQSLCLTRTESPWAGIADSRASALPRSLRLVRFVLTRHSMVLTSHSNPFPHDIMWLFSSGTFCTGLDSDSWLVTATFTRGWIGTQSRRMSPATKSDLWFDAVSTTFFQEVCFNSQENRICSKWGWSLFDDKEMQSGSSLHGNVYRRLLLQREWSSHQR